MSNRVKAYLLPFTVFALALVGGIGIGSALAGDGDTQTCPDGQHVVSFTATSGNGSLQVQQPNGLPPGAYVETKGGGTTSRSDAHSVSVSGKDLKLGVVCR